MLTRYEIAVYSTGSVIGFADLTDDQFRQYQEASQQPEGIMRLGALPHDWYTLDPHHQGTHEDTSIYLA